MQSAYIPVLIYANASGPDPGLAGVPNELGTCAACHGRRLTPFGWGAERVEHAVRRRFADARIARWDPEAARGARGEAQRAAAAAADVVIGTRGALRLFGPAALGLAAFVAPDQLLRAPDFRAGPLSREPEH